MEPARTEPATVLVAVDGSAQSQAAVSWAADEAAARKARLLVVNIVDTTFLGLWGASCAVRRELRSLAEPVVTAAVARARGQQPDLVVHGRVLLGPATRTVLLLSRGAQLTVVGHSGRGAMDRMWLGSLTQRLLVHGHGTTVVVPPDGVPGGALTGVVVGIDENANAPALLRFVFELARRRQVPLRAVYAVPTSSCLPDEPTPALYFGAWPAQYPDVSCSVVTRTGTPGAVLADACRPGDLLVLGQHRRAPLEPPRLSVVLSEALELAPCPVAVVHPT